MYIFLHNYVDVHFFIVKNAYLHELLLKNLESDPFFEDFDDPVGPPGCVISKVA